MTSPDGLRNFKRNIGEALAEKRTFKAKSGISISWWQLAIDFPQWINYQVGNSTPLSAGVPWITFGATRFLNRILTESSRVFEWGMGGSTAFFLKRCGHVISVEHDEDWYVQAKATLGERFNWKSLLIKPTPTDSPGDVSDWKDYRSSDETHRMSDFRKYAMAICDIPDESLDVVVIDGRARPSCFHHALPKVRPGGYIVWDNTERQNYKSEMDAVSSKDYVTRHFAGPQPFVPHFSRTTIWQKLHRN